MKKFSDFLAETIATNDTSSNKKILLLNFQKKLTEEQKWKKYYGMDYLPEVESEIYKHIFNKKNIATFSFGVNELVISDTSIIVGGVDIKEFDYILMSMFGWGDSKLLLETILAEIKNLRLPLYLNGTSDYNSNKLTIFQKIIHTKYKNNLLPTLIISPSNSYWRNIKSSVESYKFPIIVKKLNSVMGTGVTKINNIEELQNVFDTEIKNDRCVIQPFIENDIDYKIIVINNIFQYGIQRKHRKNASNLFKYKMWNGVPEEIKIMTEELSKKYPSNFCEFQLLYDIKQKKYLIIEINLDSEYLKFENEHELKNIETITNKILEELK